MNNETNLSGSSRETEQVTKVKVGLDLHELNYVLTALRELEKNLAKSIEDESTDDNTSMEKVEEKTGIFSLNTQILEVKELLKRLEDEEYKFV